MTRIKNKRYKIKSGKPRRTNAKHTPGPWMQKENNYGCKEIAHVGVDDDCESFFSIQEIGFTHGDANESEDQANANLIVAAPDLLEALKLLYADWKQWVTKVPTHASHKIGKKARAAIRKAKFGDVMP